MVNSRRKGKRGELEVAKEIRDVLGIEARRGVQYRGTPDSPDIVTDTNIHFEVKYSQRVNLLAAFSQAESDAGNKIPIVVWRRNRTPWFILLKLQDIPRFVAELIRSNPSLIASIRDSEQQEGGDGQKGD